jgi:hypothetical protein
MQEIEKLRGKQRPKSTPKPRIPENCPEQVIDACKRHWHGTTEYHNFMIKAWDGFNIVTVGGDKGFSDNGGFHACPPLYYVISRTEIGQSSLGNNRPKEIMKIETGRHNRATPKKYLEWLKQARETKQ